MEPSMRMLKGLPVLSDCRQLRTLRMMTWRKDILREKGLICVFIYLKYCHFGEGIKVPWEPLEETIRAKKRMLQGVRGSSVKGGPCFTLGCP